MVDKNIYIVQGEITTVVGAIKRNSRWNTHTSLDEEQDPLLNSFGQLKEILNNIKGILIVQCYLKWDWIGNGLFQTKKARTMDKTIQSGLHNIPQIYRYRDIKLCNMHTAKDGENRNKWLT
uniref:Uncharacterized protein n=1 Tax=Oryzias sinensis TaxID=183150 RepID=A0A8C7WWJ1_9TELE